MDNFSSLGMHHPSSRSEIAKHAESLHVSWNKIRDVLARELSEQSYKTWFEPVGCLGLDDQSITLAVPDNYYGQWLRDHYQDLLISAVKETLGSAREIKLHVIEKVFEDKKPALSAASALPSSEETAHNALNTRYTFDDFVIGPGNRFAHAAAMAVSEAPAKNYNPLFIYGPVGLGKTHLMQSIAHAVKRKNSSSRVLYISSEKFTNQLITSIQKRSTQQFRNKYRNLDLLLIDDIHFIAEKEATQEEFFHTFNALYDAHKQIVVSSDRPPREIPGLEERLVSRFGWGLVTDIQPPDFETRVAILKKKMEKETVTVSDEICYFIASKLKSNVRELEGALIRVVAYGALTGQPITLPLAHEILSDSLREEASKLSIEKIQMVVADYFGIRISDLRVKKRTLSITGPRQIAMYLVRSLTHHSLPEIGEFFGGRDHTTVIHACNKITDLLNKDEKTIRVVNELKDLLKK